MGFSVPCVLKGPNTLRFCGFVEDDEEQGNWDGCNAAIFSRRERRRQKALDARASTWIKLGKKAQKEKKNLICLGERGERDKWPEAWKAFYCISGYVAGDCSEDSRGHGDKCWATMVGNPKPRRRRQRNACHLLLGRS